jgi:phosphoribosylanthranilate isomerase
MWVKICGITSLEDALTASTFGADAVGFVFADSPRRVTLETARSISLGMPAGPKRVGVFVDSPLEEVQETIRYCGLDLVQLHGTESPEYCSELRDKAIKAIRVRDGMDVVRSRDYRGCRLLFDCHDPARAGGTGRSFDWKLLRLIGDRTRAIIAGGLRPLNLAHAIDLARPYGVDVSSGVEVEPGRKDPVLMYEFIEKARKADFEVSRC